MFLSRISYFFPYALFFLALILSSSSVHSAEIDSPEMKDGLSRFKKAMPEIESIDQGEFEKITDLFELKPTGDKSLAYKIRIPKDWTKAEETASSNFHVSDKLLTQLAVFYGPPSIYGQEKLLVRAVSLDFDMDAEEWFIIDLMKKGLTSEGYKYHDKNRCEGLVLLMEDDVSYAIRSKIIVNGKRVLVAEHYVPIDIWDERAALQEKIIGAFDILNKVEATVLELDLYQMLDIAKIYYPSYWDDKPGDLTSVERLGVKFLSFFKPDNFIKKSSEPSTNNRIMEVTANFDKTLGSENLQGVIDVLVIAIWSVPSLLDEIENYKKEFEKNETIIGDRIDLVKDMRYSELATFGVTEVYKMINNKDNSSDYELWFTVIVSGNYYYFLSLVTPSRNDNYPLWVQNTRSFRVMLANLEPTASKKEE